MTIKDEVVEAVRAGRFHIYAVSTIDEGIEVLTGVPAGKLQDDGTYPEGTVHYHVEKRLEELAKKSRDYGKTPDEAKEDNNKPEQG